MPPRTSQNEALRGSHDLSTNKLDALLFRFNRVSRKEIMATKTKAKAKTKKSKIKAKLKKKSAPKRTHPKLALTEKQRLQLKKRIMQLREEAGFSRGELAERMGCGATYLYQMENLRQESIISIPALFSLSRALKKSPSALLKGIK